MMIRLILLIVCFAQISCAPLTCHYQYTDAPLYCQDIQENDVLDERHHICKDYKLMMVCDER